MSRHREIVWLLLVGVAFHCVYMCSIFDIYFRSPLVHGMTPEPTDKHVDGAGHNYMAPPADRVVLFVADGLRADRLFEDASRAPFLHSIAHRNGSFGVSHTRVPTESRPGHVAVIAGFYEDVSAVTKGWKVNPVEFDSLFNESRRTWAFGSPDILPMFKLGASNAEKIETFMYSHEEEDFSKKDASVLDKWVFDAVRELFSRAAAEPALDTQLRQNKVVFFLHLLGLDTNGHAHWPHSKEYIENIRTVDAGIQRMVQLFDSFYGNDKRTTFVFTADHGMSNTGSHGDGNPDNTRTPLIAWGAGINKPVPSGDSSSHGTEYNWTSLNGLERIDVNQADIAPLMASSIGVPFPLNSVGVLPLGYIESSDQRKAIQLLVNAKQISRQFLMKQERKRKRELFFAPFEPLSNNTHGTDLLLEKVANLISAELYAEANSISLVLIDLALEGLRYYQRYDWLLLRSIVSVGYLGWIVYSSVFVLRLYVLNGDDNTTRSRVVDAFGLATITVLSSLFWYKEADYLYYFYALFPVCFWVEFIQRRRLLMEALTRHSAGTAARWWRSVSVALMFVLGMELLVLSYFYRQVLAVGFLGIGVAWPWSMDAKFRQSHQKLLAGWSLSCLCTAVFPCLSTELGENITMCIVGAVMVICIGISFMRHVRQISPTSGADLLLQTGLVLLAIIVVVHTQSLLQAKSGLPALNQIAAWGLLVCSMVVPVFTLRLSRFYIHRVATIFLAFSCPMVILAVSYETMFYCFFSLTLYLWLCVEYESFNAANEWPLRSGDSAMYQQVPMRLRSADLKDKIMPSQSPTYRSLELSDLRRAWMFLFFINVAFFGTGNIASVSSFNLKSILRLLPTFAPFTMGALLIWKILIPFFLVSSVFGIVIRAVQLPTFSLFVLVMAVTDIMTLNFFFLVRDEGSWLEIGTSISHFIIACSFEVLSVLLFVISWLLVGDVLIHSRVTAAKKAS